MESDVRVRRGHLCSRRCRFPLLISDECYFPARGTRFTIEVRADHPDMNSCKYGYDIPIINVKSNTKVSGRRKQVMPQATQPGIHITDCYDEVQVYQIRLPYTTTNCSRAPHVVPPPKVAPPPHMGAPSHVPAHHVEAMESQSKKRKKERSHLKRSKRHKLSLNSPRFDTDLSDMRGVEEEYMKKEERRKSIRDKLERGQEYLFTKLEERDIHERAEIYSMSVSPDEDYYIPPEEQNPDSMILTSNGCSHHSRSYQIPKKRKRRNYMSDSVFLTYHNESDPYDNSHKLPIGSKLIRPPDKLVELVGQAIDGSPDGLLQVPQIYTVVQNRYPYFRYMDRAALGSWRSSIRHALYQKWFRKIRFGTHAINTKGCYWANNHTYVPVNRKEETIIRRHKPHRSSGTPSKKGSKKHDFDDFDLDPDTHDKVIALLTEEEEKELDLQRDYNSLEDVVCIANEYGITLEECGSVLGVDNASASSDTVPSPVKDPDPILSTCGLDWQTGPRDSMLSSFDRNRNVTSPASHPVSWCEQQQAINSISCPASSSQVCPSLTSPLLPSRQAEILRLDYRLDNQGSLLSDPQMGMGPASQSSEGYHFSTEPCDMDTPISFDIEQLPEMYNSDMYMPENYLNEFS